MKRVYVIGVGLIGGSMALNIKKLYPAAHLTGVDTNEHHLQTAMKLKIIDDVATLDCVEQADLVILATPVDVALRLLSALLDQISKNSLIIDMSSTKEKLCRSVENHPKRTQWLSAHPIAGTEYSGPSAAIEHLFEGKTNIVCEIEKTSYRLQKKGLDLFSKMKMHIRYMDPKAHDRHIAYVSHLSHISSFMLGKTVLAKEKNERDIFDLAGSGFESTVRLAKSSPAMWTPIFEQNKENVLETLSEYIDNLTMFKELMKNDKFDELFKEMKKTNYISQVLKG